MLEPGCLKYSLEKNGLVKESFILSQCTMRLCSDDPVRLDIDVVGRGLICLRTDTPAEKHRWVVAFKKAQKILFQAYQKKVLTPSGVYKVDGLSSGYAKQRESPTADKQAVPGSRESFFSVEQPGNSPVVGTEGTHTVTVDTEDLADNGESKSVDVSELFVKTRVGQELQTALNCMLSNTTCFDEITKKIIEEIKALSQGEALKKLETLSLVAKEYCSSIQLLYLEEVRERKDLEQSLFRATRRNMKFEQQDQQRVAPEHERGARSSIENQMHVSNKYHEMVSEDSDSSGSDYCGHRDEEFFECEDYIRSCSPGEMGAEKKANSEFGEEQVEIPTQEVVTGEKEPELQEQHQQETVVENKGDDLEEETPEQTAVEPDAPQKAPVVIRRRTRLPKPHSELKVSIWSILKDLIGKDLSRISMPICLNEPTSGLQRSSEDFEYCSLLTDAAAKADVVERMAYVTIFSITPYQSAVARTYKPFNPMLGETYEYTHRGFKFMAEQVGHHPPISAFHCYNDHFESYGSTNALVKLTGKSVEVSIIGPFMVDLNVNGEKEKYKLQRCYVVVHNIIFGKMWLEVVGTAIIRNTTSGEFSVVQYLRKGWFDKEMHKVRAIVFDNVGTPRYYLSGKWSEVVYMEQVRPGRKIGQKKVLLADGSLDYERSLYKNEEDAWDAFVNEIDWDKIDLLPGTRKEVWRPNKRPSYYEQYYGFGYMTMELNELSEDYDPKKGAVIPPTDSRFRPDLRAYENGEMELASAEKTRLEERQREAAKNRIDGEKSYQPLWFHKNIDAKTRQTTWDFKGDYWQKKENGTIADGIVNIFE